MTPAQYKGERKKRGLTQKGVAALLDVDWMTIQRRELNKLKISTESAIAIANLPLPAVVAVGRK